MPKDMAASVRARLLMLARVRGEVSTMCCPGIDQDPRIPWDPSTGHHLQSNLAGNKRRVPGFMRDVLLPATLHRRGSLQLFRQPET